MSIGSELQSSLPRYSAYAVCCRAYATHNIGVLLLSLCPVYGETLIDNFSSATARHMFSFTSTEVIESLSDTNLRHWAVGTGLSPLPHLSFPTDILGIPAQVLTKSRDGHRDDTDL